MQQALVMTILGPDRPGLVESVSSIVARHQGNWLESRMSRLGGFFAGILRVEVPAQNLQELSQALQTLSNRGLSVVVHADTSSAPAPAEGRTQRIEIVGQDRPGIVRQISQALASHGVNVEELHSETCSAAMSGETLFKADVLMHVPPSCNMSSLRAELEKIAADLIIDVSFVQK